LVAGNYCIMYKCLRATTTESACQAESTFYSFPLTRHMHVYVTAASINIMNHTKLLTARIYIERDQHIRHWTNTTLIITKLQDRMMGCFKLYLFGAWIVRNVVGGVSEANWIDGFVRARPTTKKENQLPTIMHGIGTQRKRDVDTRADWDICSPTLIQKSLDLLLKAHFTNRGVGPKSFNNGTYLKHNNGSIVKRFGVNFPVCEKCYTSRNANVTVLWKRRYL